MLPKYLFGKPKNALEGENKAFQALNECPGCKNRATDAELEAVKGLGLVAPADPSVPAEVLQGATEEAALRCVLESFTAEESHALVEYLEKRYADQIEKITVCPLDLPVPMGVAPLAGICEGKTNGFIRFDAVRDYPLSFPAYGFYDLTAQRPS